MPNTNNTPVSREELTKLFFSTRRSQTVLQEVLTGCEVCERPLEEERFWDTERDEIVKEQSPIVDAILELFNQSLKAFADEVEPVKEAATYMISVWDEVTPSWRETPDHVAKKFIEAESALKDLKEKWGIDE